MLQRWGWEAEGGFPHTADGAQRQPPSVRTVHKTLKKHCRRLQRCPQDLRGRREGHFSTISQLLGAHLTAIFELRRATFFLNLVKIGLKSKRKGYVLTNEARYTIYSWKMNEKSNIWGENVKKKLFLIFFQKGAGRPSGCSGGTGAVKIGGRASRPSILA